MRRRTIAVGSFVLAALMVIVSLAGILVPATYARETADWRAQALGQDWFDLLVAAPWLVACAAGTLRGRGHWHLLLGGGLLYAVYTFVIYAFSVHFGALFPIYCAALGLAFYLGLFLLLDLPAPARPTRPARATGILLLAIGGLFALLWLAEIAAAIAAGEVPASLQQTGLPSNPVHVMDLAIVLPAHVIAGVALLYRRPAGVRLAPLLLAFGVLMASSIAGMMIAMQLLGAGAALPVAGAMLALAALSALALVRFLRALEPAHSTRSARPGLERATL
jgi:hypothetical protein